MPCPTCSCTLGKLCDSDRGPHWLCERCGTVVVYYPGDGEVVRDIYVPALVNRCRKFEPMLALVAARGDATPWRTLGIAEAINTPENRPQ